MLEGDQRSRWRPEMFCLAATEIVSELSVCRWCDSSVQPLGGHSGNILALTLMLTLTLMTSLKHEQGHSSPPDTSAGMRPWSGFTLCRLSCFIKVFHVWPHGGSERTKESVWTVKTSGMNSGVIINSTVCSRLCLELTAAFISESTCPVDLNAPEALLPEHLQLRLADKSMKKQRWVSRGV